MIKMKKLLAIGLAAAMTMGLCLPAFAEDITGRMEDNKGIIKIEKTVKDETYKVYKIFDLQSFADDDTEINKHSGDRYSYLLPTDSKWVDFFKSGKEGYNYVDVDFAEGHEVTVGDKTYYQVIGYKTGTDAFNDDLYTEEGKTFETDYTDEDTIYKHTSQAFARAALAYATSNSINPVKTETGTGSEITLSDMDLGYYLLSTSAGTLLSLDTTNLTATVYEKNDVPDVFKTVQEDGAKTAESTTLGDGNFGDGNTDYTESNDVNIGQKVYYRTIIEVEKGAVNYVLHDTMSEGLTFDTTSLKVYKSLRQYATEDTTVGTIDPTKWESVASTNYTLTTPTADGHTFDVTFKQVYLDDLDTLTTSDTADKKYSLVVLYEATLNKNAVVCDVGNTNKTTVTYGDKQKTTEDTTTTYTWLLDVLKYTGVTTSVLEGAQFQIKKGETVLKFVKVADGSYRYDDRAQEATIPSKAQGEGEDVIKEGTATVEGETVKVVDTVTTASGMLTVTGLDGDDYVIVETLAPKGYNKLANPIPVHITSVSESPVTLKDNVEAESGDVYYIETSALAKLGTSDTLSKIEIENKAGTELPSTGGIGTTMFYIIGSILVVGAGLLLVTKRRMSMN